MGHSLVSTEPFQHMGYQKLFFDFYRLRTNKALKLIRRIAIAGSTLCIPTLAEAYDSPIGSTTAAVNTPADNTSEVVSETSSTKSAAGTQEASPSSNTAKILARSSVSQHLPTGTDIPNALQLTPSAAHTVSLKLSPNERIRIPVQLYGSAAAWKIQIQVSGWWQVLHVQVQEVRRSGSTRIDKRRQDSSSKATDLPSASPLPSVKPGSVLATTNTDNKLDTTSIADREWRPRLDELIYDVKAGPKAARFNERELFFFSNRSDVVIELVNRSQSQSVKIDSLSIVPVSIERSDEVRTSGNAAASHQTSATADQSPSVAPGTPTLEMNTKALLKRQSPIASSLITEYLSTEESSRLLEAGRRLQNDAPDSAQFLQTAIQSWLHYAKRRGVQCISVPVIFRRGSLYASDHVFKKPIGNATHSPDSQPSDAPFTERFPSIDLVEEIYRACDETGILFCPVIDLSFPISELEILSSKVVESPYRSDLAPPRPIVWNPQSPAVREALTQLLQELPKRYSHLNNYHGFAITVEPNSAWWLEFDTHALQPNLIEEATRSTFRFESSPASLSNQNASTGQSRVIGSKEFQNWQRDRLYQTFSEASQDIVRIYGPSQVHSPQFASNWQYLNVENSLGATPRNMLNDWWSHGIRPKCYSLSNDGNRERYHQNSISMLPTSEMLPRLKPVPRSRDVNSPDRTRLWQSDLESKAALCLNANPWPTNIKILWDQDPGTISLLDSKFSNRSTEVASSILHSQTSPANNSAAGKSTSPNELQIHLPPICLLPFTWSNQEAKIIGWHNPNDHTIDDVQTLLNLFETAMSSLSVPQTEGGLLFNGGFEIPPDQRSHQIAKGWATSLNPKAIFHRSQRKEDANNDSIVLVNTDQAQTAWLQSEDFVTDRSKLQIAAWISTTSSFKAKNIESTQVSDNASTKNADLLAQEKIAQASGKVLGIRVGILLWNPEAERFERVATQSLTAQRQTENGWQLWSADATNALATYFRDGTSHRIKLHWEIVSEGTIELDNLTATSDFLLESERVELRNRLFVARQSLKDANIEPSIKLLEFSWPRLLRNSPGKVVTSP